MKRIFLAVLLLFILALPVSAGAPTKRPLDFTNYTGGGQSNTIIEKQTWYLDCCTPDPSHIVINPHNGIGTWDINEHNGFAISGYLNAGQSSSGTYKHVWDFTPMYSCRPYCANWSGNSNRFSFGAEAPSDKLLVSLCFSPQGRCFTLQPVFYAPRKSYIYSICTQVLYSQDDPNVIDIAGSNGGRGVPSVMTMSITNTNTQATHRNVIDNIRASWGLSSDIFNEVYCDNTFDFTNGEYPFGWE